MADKKITDLQQVSAITDDLNFPVDDTLQTYRGTIGQVKNYLAPVYISPSRQTFTSGSGTYKIGHAFMVSGASCTIGATYTNNGNTYTVIRTVSSSNIVWLAGDAAPTASGTLTKSGGTGDTSISFTDVRKAVHLKIRAVGGGGGGAGSANLSDNGSNGSAGGDTSFGTSLIVAKGGSGGIKGGAVPGGAGGTSGTLASPAEGSKFSGEQGGGSSSDQSGGQFTYAPGGKGGGSAFFGGGGPSSYAGSAGIDAIANTGGGGSSGGPIGGGVTYYTGGGGGGGESIEAIIPSPSYSYSYSIGAGGTKGNAGSSGFNGSNGASGIIIVEEFYQ